MNNEDEAEFHNFIKCTEGDNHLNGYIKTNGVKYDMIKRSWEAACDHKIMTEAAYYLPVIQDLKDRLKEAESIMIYLSERISKSPKTRCTNQDEFALDAFEDCKTKHL